MKITSVAISGMHHITNKSYKFQDINYLHGKNGAGKSTILNAIQLAILGYIPGTAKQNAAIFQHASSPELRIVVHFDDGRLIERKWNVKGRSVESHLSGSFTEDTIKDLIRDLELPIFNFGELVGLTANKLKDWFINFLPGDSIDINWKEELLSSLGGLEMMDASLLETALETLQVDDGKSLIEKIQAFNAVMKGNQSYLKSELQRAESTIQSLIFYDEEGLVGDAEYLDNEIQKYKHRIQELTAEKEDLIRATQIQASNQSIRNQIAELNPPSEDQIQNFQDQFTAVGEQIAEIEKSIHECESAMLELTTKASSLNAEINANSRIINSGGMCPYTQTVCDSISAKAAELSESSKRKGEEVSQISGEIAKIRSDIDAKKQSINELRSKARILHDKIIHAQNASNNLDRLNSMLQPVPDMSSFSTLGFYGEEIARLNQQISKIEANKQYNALVDTMTADKYRMENSIEVLKCWVKLTDPNGLQTKVMDAPFKQLASDMDRYLRIMFSTDVHCNFNLEQKANSFSFGILRGSKYIPYDLLSSGEKTMYTLALMLCIVHRSSSAMKLLIVDDMLDHLDDDRADEVFKALCNIEDVQVIVAGVKNSTSAEPCTIEITN